MSHPDDILDSLVLSAPKGKTASPAPEVVLVRNLSPDDLAKLNSGGTALVPQQEINNLRYKHHLAARLLSTGMNDVSVCAATGYTASYLSGVLKKSPAFQDLCAYYHEQESSAFEMAREQLTTLGMTALEEMQRRLDDEEESRSMGMTTLKEVAEMAFERSVAPKKGNAQVSAGANGGDGKSLNVHLHFSDGKEAAEAKPSAVIDIEANEEPI